MANYINLNILSQSYIHIEPVNLAQNEIEAFQSYISQFVSDRGKFFLYPDVQIDVAIKEGSLKSYATVLGTIYAVYLGIGNYGDFRQGISLLYEDCRRLAESVCNESLFQSKARNPEIIRIEARTGVIGSLKKILQTLIAFSDLTGKSRRRRWLLELRLFRMTLSGLFQS